MVGYAGTEADHFDQGSQSSRVSRNVGSAPMSSKEIRSTEEQDKEEGFGIRAFFRPVGPIAFSTVIPESKAQVGTLLNAFMSVREASQLEIGILSQPTGHVGVGQGPGRCQGGNYTVY